MTRHRLTSGLHRCRCCRRKGVLNEQRFCVECAVCLHCEAGPTVHRWGLCLACVENYHIKVLYRRHHWTPEWEQHLRRLTAEVQAALRREEAPPAATSALDPSDSIALPGDLRATGSS
jgi:hypothetical protein